MARVWTQEQRKAAAERMKVAQALRWANKGVNGPKIDYVAIDEEVRPVERDYVRVVDPRPDAVEELEKSLAVAQAVIEKPVQRIRITEYHIIAKNDGTMASQIGPCLCGAAKREWHKQCLGGKNGKE